MEAPTREDVLMGRMGLATELHTWELELEKREGQGGLGYCESLFGSHSPVRCALGSVGCRVDHMQIARINSRLLHAEIDDTKRRLVVTHEAVRRIVRDELNKAFRSLGRLTGDR